MEHHHPHHAHQPPTAADAAARVAEAQERFIGAWGQMASAWGISRTMAEVFALLYITGDGLCTDDVIERLQISRGNASMSLRALQEWGVINRVHKRGDRKEYFESERDVWLIFKTIARERKKRELDPVLATLYEVRDMTGVGPAGGDGHASEARNGGGGARAEALARLAGHNERLDAMLDFMSAMEKLASLLLTPEGAGLRQALALFEK